MRTYAESGFQMFGVHQQSGKVITVCIQSEENAYPYIVNTPFHSTVHGFRVVGIVAFRSGGVEGFVVFFMISLLKQYISADACLFQPAVVFYRSGCNIYVHPTDSPVFMFDTVNRPDRFQNIFYRIQGGMFSCFECQALVPHIL